MKILIATSNPGKVREFREVLGNHSISYVDLSGFPRIQEVEETGNSFGENAVLKATGYAKQTGLCALADDSGLMVDALHGSPGIWSARWAQRHGRSGGDEENNRLLLEQMENVPDSKRSARFFCALALADEKGQLVGVLSDTVNGTILRQPRGSNGFGYDPLFFIPELNRTAAELSPQEKSQISHRGKALRKMKDLLGNYSR